SVNGLMQCRKGLPAGQLELAQPKTTSPATIPAGDRFVDPFARRRRRLIAAIREADIDLLLVSNPVNVTYLTGFSGDSSWLLIGLRRALLASDGRYTTQIAEECPGLDVHIRDTQKTIVQAVAGLLPKLGVRNIGVEASISLAEMETLKSLAPS